MLTQKKRKRTIEDFNQFCTFVLAHAGYIPFPTEEWQSKDNVPRENIACIPQHGADWACFSSSPDSLCAPTQTKSWAEVHPGEELKKGGFKEKKKRREQEKSVLQRERKPWRSEGHAKKTKTSTHNKAMKDPQFKRVKGNILCKRFSAEGTSPEVDSNGDADFKPVSTSLSQSRHQPLSEDCRCMDVRVDCPPVFKQEPTTEYCRTVPETPKENLTGETGVRRQPGCRIPARLTGDIPERREEKEHEVAVELLGPTSTSQTDCIQKREIKPEEWEEEQQRRSREAPWGDGGLKMENERDEEGWERSAAGGTDILCLVMERRLGQLLPEDQETGYHTDWDGSTPDQGGSDSDQATTPTAHCDTAASSAYSTEDMPIESSKMEDDDSWDLITCFCLKPFAGRPMIECSECGTWVHLSCAKIRRTHVPDVFVCQPCRDAKQNIRRSSRPRTAPRKRFSD